MACEGQTERNGRADPDHQAVAEKVDKHGGVDHPWARGFLAAAEALDRPIKRDESRAAKAEPEHHQPGWRTRKRFGMSSTTITATTMPAATCKARFRVRRSSG